MFLALFFSFSFYNLETSSPLYMKALDFSKISSNIYNLNFLINLIRFYTFGRNIFWLFW